MDFWSSGWSRSLEDFPDPLLDYTGAFMPREARTMLQWCERLWSNNGTYRMALERVCSYFLTAVELLEVTDSVKERYEDFLNDTLRISEQLRNVGLDFLFYGNSFTSLYTPFRRYLRCPRCQAERPIEKQLFTFRDFKFFARCEHCAVETEQQVVDRPSMETDKFRVVRWSPHQIKILHHPITHESCYLLDLPASLKEHVRQGRTFYVQHTPQEFIDAVKHNQLFRFADGIVYHLKEDTLAGLQNRGWGIPRALSGFKLGYYIQILRRYNEALAMDYIVPWRVITPAPSPGGNLDPLLHANLGEFNSKVRGMIREHRLDPLSVHALPFPVQYSVLGGEAKALAPQELITAALDELLNSSGVPAELYKGTLQLQSAPTSLRLFEATWPHLVAGLNAWLNWLLEGVSQTFHWERARGRLTPVTRADDIEARVVRLQLAAANKISDQTALSPLGVDVRDEIRRIFDERRMLREEQQRADREEIQAQEMQRRLAETAARRQGLFPGMPMMGAPPGGPMGAPLGAPAGSPGPSTGIVPPVTPQDQLATAEQMAQQLVAMPEGDRRRQLGQLRQHDPALHAVVKEMMSRMRTQARSVGQDQVIAQMAGAPM